MANVQLNLGTGGVYVATDSITRDTVTEEIELITISYTPDGSTLNKAVVDSNGLHVNVNGPLPAGGNTIGAVTISGTTTVGEDGCSYLNVNDGSAHTITGTLLVGFQELSGSNQGVSIKACDGASMSGTVLTPPAILGAGQILTYPRGGIKTTNSNFTVQCSSAPTTPGIQVLYHA